MDAATSTLGRRDRKRHATRHAIVEAALDLFEQQGFAATTVDEIAERADVAQRTFFRHFPTKEAVLFPDREDGDRAFRAAVAARPAGEPLLACALGAFITALDETDEDHKLTARRQAIVVQEGAAGEEITWTSMAAGHRTIEEALADHAGVPVGDEQVHLVSGIALLLLSQAMMEWFTTGAEGDVEEILARKLGHLRDVVSS